MPFCLLPFAFYRVLFVEDTVTLRERVRVIVLVPLLGRVVGTGDGLLVSVRDFVNDKEPVLERVVVGVHVAGKDTEIVTGEDGLLVPDRVRLSVLVAHIVLVYGHVVAIGDGLLVSVRDLVSDRDPVLESVVVGVRVKG